LIIWEIWLWSNVGSGKRLARYLTRPMKDKAKPSLCFLTSLFDLRVFMAWCIVEVEWPVSLLSL